VGSTRVVLLELFEAAVAAAAPAPATARAVGALRIDRTSRVWVFAFGKAARSMAAAAVTSLLDSMHAVVGGVVVSPEEGPPPYPSLVAMRGDHPIPGRHSFAAASRLGEVATGRLGNDVALVLLSGGTSSLIGAPLRGMNESDFTSLYELLLGSGLDIAAMNAVRKRFSRWSAGRLAVALAPATTYCLAISDVEGDDMSVIGSGPCSPDSTTVQEVTAILQGANLLSRLPATHREYLASVARGAIPETPSESHPAFAHVTSRVIGNNRMALDGVAEAAREQGLDAHIARERLTGEASRVGEKLARQLVAARAQARGRCFVWGGETTVTLNGGSGGGRPTGGGRCQELALAAARVLHDAGEKADGITVLAAGTDGRDGATDAAGAIVDAETWQSIATSGRDPAHALASHESNGALKAAGALIGRRDTGTNVNDVVIGLT
jgi:glycerate-2-kinase